MDLAKHTSTSCVCVCGGVEIAFLTDEVEMPARFLYLRRIRSGMFRALCMRRSLARASWSYWVSALKLCVRRAMNTSARGLAKSSPPRPWRGVPLKVIALRKRNHLAVFDLAHEIRRQRSISYNPILFVADGGRCDGRKLQNGRPQQRNEKKRRKGRGREGWQKHTLVT